jgi:hypothetical protein
LHLFVLTTDSKNLWFSLQILITLVGSDVKYASITTPFEIPDPDCVKMMTLGRQFTIGTLYNYAEDTIVPSKLQ